MIRFVCGLFVVLSCWLATTSMAEEIRVDAPPVMLQYLPVDIAIEHSGDQPLTVTLGGTPLALSSSSKDTSTYTATRSESGSADLVVMLGSDIVAEQTVPVIAGWISVLPPLIAILLAFALRSVVPALFAGLVAGAWAINGLTFDGAIKGLFDTLGIYILNAISDPDHAAVMLFTLMIGGMVGIISRNGGMVGIVHRVLPIARTPRRGQAVVAMLGLSIFFDDYSNTLIVGNTTRPMADHLRISREKLAYLVDSTAAPVATVAVITTWIGFQVGLIEEAISGIEELSEPAYTIFLQSIPYSFYPFLALLLVFLVVVRGKDFGPMYRAEIRARLTGHTSNASAEGEGPSEIDEIGHKDGIPCRAVNGVVPILSLVVGVIGGLYISGEGNTVKEIIGTADAYMVLIWASLLGCLVAAVLSLGQRILSLNELVDAWTSGAKFMLTGLVLLVMAWSIAEVSSVLQTAPYLISILGDSLSPKLLPTGVFLLAAAAGFATGSSWGVMAILMPLVIPLCWAVLQTNGIADAAHMHILYSCIACVLTGAVWSDHCSPISDTTVLSSLATGCDHMDHVATQLPYALLSGAIAILLCTLPAGYGMQWWMALGLGAAVLIAAHHYLGKPTDPA
jgi:Na+/H+ antiporter NhaC